ncbi:mitochondrial inner membrane protease subunit 1 isoform X2 [Chelonoidis abingdonii]|uniref:mitochondrial inner membrane protease subunit 1 isoform X2 n=1 Tax=Chelonoidis abingdonii TaxID=106734 RepID=UPI0013F1A177|nr:mitochondrial inner membrane protease subunit 1 isoform X7 [Chelonoidis abingdonii]
MLRDVMGKTFRLLGYTIQYGCIAHCAFEYLGGIVVCSGPSMEPTIQNSDIVFSENLSRHFYCIQKGDIVIAKSPNDPKSNICKRVIGLEGDKVCISSPSDFRKSHSYNILLGGQSKAWAQSKDLVCLQLLWRQEHSLTWKVYKENSQCICVNIRAICSSTLKVHSSSCVNSDLFNIRKVSH